LVIIETGHIDAWFKHEVWNIKCCDFNSCNKSSKLLVLKAIQEVIKKSVCYF